MWPTCGQTWSTSADGERELRDTCSGEFRVVLEHIRRICPRDRRGAEQCSSSVGLFHRCLRSPLREQFRTCFRRGVSQSGQTIEGSGRRKASRFVHGHKRAAATGGECRDAKPRANHDGELNAGSKTTPKATIRRICRRIIPHI